MYKLTFDTVKVLSSQILVEWSLIQFHYVHQFRLGKLTVLPSSYHVLTLLPQHAKSTLDGCWPNALQK